VQVPAYRLFKLGDADRIAGPSTMVECHSDAEVIAKAKAMLGGLDIEIWDGLASSCGFRPRTPNRRY
jgi:hypothetical protein